MPIEEETGQFYNFLVIQLPKGYKVFDLEYGSIKYRFDIDEKYPSYLA